MASNIPTLSDIIQSSPVNSDIVNSPPAAGSRRSSKGDHSRQTDASRRSDQHAAADRDENDTLVGLSTKRDKLLARRKQLQQQIRQLDLDMSNYEPQSGEERLRVRRRKRQQGTDELDKLRQELNRLPVINNWNLRLELLKFFQPDLVITVSSLQVVENLKYVRYAMKYHKLFKVLMTLRIDMDREVMVEFFVKFENGPADLIDAVHGMKDITKFVYATNSYVRLLLKKINVWLQIYEDYHDRYRINDFESTNELINFFRAKNSPTLTVVAPDESKLVFVWSFVIDEFAEFATEIKCLHQRGEVTTNYDELLSEIVVSEGVLKGLCTLIDRLLPPTD